MNDLMKWGIRGAQEKKILEYLAHHGVKGQRWGVRRTKAALARAAKREKPNASADHAHVKALLKKPRHQLTNAELKIVNERLNLEANAGRLNPHVVSKGEQTAKAVLGTIGVGVTAFNLIKSPAGQAAIKVGSKTVQRIISLPGGLPINVP